MGAGAAIRRATKLACAIGAIGGILGAPAMATANVTHPFLPQDRPSFLAAKRAAQAQAGLGSPLGPLMAPAVAGPKAVVAPSFNQSGLVAGDNTPVQHAPPDPTGAVGPNHYVEFVNSVVGVYSKADLTQVGNTAQLDTFVGAAADDVFDPQIQYDPVAARWFYLADDCSTDCSAGNYLAYGWSKTNDPSDLINGWCRFRVRTDTGAAGSTGYLDDYPKLGHNDSHLVFGTNVFDFSALQPPFVSARIWTVPKPPLGTITNCATGTGAPHWFSGTAASPVKDQDIAADPLLTSDNDFAFTPVPANTQDASPNAYIVAADFPTTGNPATGNQIMAWHMSVVAGSEALIADGNIGVSSFSLPANVPQPGTTDVLDSSDTRVTQAVAYTDPDAGAEAVWTQHTINGPGGRSVVRWYELLPGSLTRRQEGNISNASNFVFNGAISPTMAGNDAVIQYNFGGSSQLAQIRAKSRTNALPLGSMTGEVVLGTSAAADQDFTCPSGPAQTAGPSCRWGDYAGASPDPSNSNLVWGTNQLTASPSGFSARWTTQNFALTANATPVASFTVSPNPEFTGRVVNFNASGSSGTIDSYDWDFDGNGTFDLVNGGANPSHTYSQGGTFNVQLRVTEAGSTDTTTRSLTINSGAPTAAFTAAPAVVNRGQSVSFDGSASTDAEASGGIESYRWDFDGDGVTDQTTTTGPVVTHAYTALGTFNARLAVTDADEHQLSPAASRQVTVQNVAPIAQITFSPGAPATGQPVSFSAAGASDPDGTIVNYRWDLDGDGVFETNTGAQPQATRSYSTPGTFGVTVRVQDNDGAPAMAGSSVRVVAAPVVAPVAPFTAASLKLALKLSRNARLATLFKRGLAGSVNCGRPCTVRLTLRISSKLARQMKTLAVIGKSTISVKSSGAKTVRIRLTPSARKHLGNARSFAITVTGTATDSARHSASGRATVRVRR